MKRKEEESKAMSTHLFNQLQKNDEAYEAKERELSSIEDKLEISDSRSQRLSREFISLNK